MSHVKILVHVVFSTKDRIPFLSKSIRQDVFRHILDNSKKKKINIITINGYKDHAHCLLSLAKDQTISNVVQLIKGESSHWINQNKIVKGKFSWQDDYFAVSIGESQVERVVNYINNQEMHHSKKSFSDEIDELIKVYGFKLMKDE